MKRIADFDNEKVALLLIDIQKEYSPDPNVANDDYGNAYNFEEYASNCGRVLEACRKKGYPIIHLQYWLDRHVTHPFDDVDENGDPVYCIRGSEGSEEIDEVAPIEGECVIPKQRWSAFYETCTDLVLRKYKIERVVIIGGITDCCVLNTAYDAWARDYTVTLVKDAITAASEGEHKAGILTMANWVYGVSIFTTEEFEKALEGKEHSAWYWERANSVPYETYNIDELYDSLQ